MGEKITAIEVWGEVGCNYLDCPIISECRLNKSVRIAKVRPEEVEKLVKLANAWVKEREVSCYQDGNANNGRRVEIQHFSNVEKSLIYCQSSGQ